MRRIVVVGAGGHGKVVVEAIRAGGCFEIVGLIDQRADRAGGVLDLPLLGDDSLLFRHAIEADCVAIGVGLPRVDGGRAGLFWRVKACQYELPAIVHPSAIVAGAAIADGVQIMARAVVQPGAVLDENCIINTAAVVEHDCRVEAHAHIAPGAILGGGVVVGTGALVGIGACVLPGVKIGCGATVGAGAVVVRDVADGVTVAGVPAVVLPARITSEKGPGRTNR